MGYNPLGDIPALTGLEVIDGVRRIDLPNLDELYRLYREVGRLSAVAQQAGIGTSTLHRKLRAAGFDLRRGRYPDGATLRRLYVDERLTCTVIGTRYGVSFATAAKWIKAAGLTRTASEAMYLRMGQASDTGRTAITEAANAARRGRRDDPERKARRAVTRQVRELGVSALDRQLCRWLLEADPTTAGTLVKAIGPYNVDVAVSPAIAVELWGGAWHRKSRATNRHRERTRYLLDAGWHLVIVECANDGFALSHGAAEYVLAFREQVGRDPTARREYRVVRGTGQELIRGCAECDQFPFKLPARRPGHLWCPHQLIAG